jgi:hypothetical protein
MPLEVHPIVGITLIFAGIVVFLYVRIRFTPSLRDHLMHMSIDGELPVKEITVADLYEVAQTGDILLMSGTTFNEKMVRWWTDAPVSHVGLIVRETDVPNAIDTLFLWEADVGQGSVAGSRLISLRQKLELYKGEHTAIYIPLLAHNKRQTPTIDPDGMELLRKYVHTTHKSMDRLFTRYFFAAPESETSVYCSELACNTLQVAKVMKAQPLTLSPADWFPTSFDAGTTRAGRMLLPPYSYGPWYVLTF